MASDQLDEKDKKKVTQQLKEIRAFLKELEDAGIEVPPALKRSLNRLQVALDTAEDLGEAFEEASQALATLEKDLMSACTKVDDEMRAVCEAKVARQWQARRQVHPRLQEQRLGQRPVHWEDGAALHAECSLQALGLLQEASQLALP